MEWSRIFARSSAFTRVFDALCAQSGSAIAASDVCPGLRHRA
jgi:hypothetical protein